MFMLLQLYELVLQYRPKHPTKVHVWAGISRKGRTGICIFEGIMKKELYVEILGATLVPFLRDVYPAEHKFMQDVHVCSVTV